MSKIMEFNCHLHNDEKLERLFTYDLIVYVDENFNLVYKSNGHWENNAVDIPLYAKRTKQFEKAALSLYPKKGIRNIVALTVPQVKRLKRFYMLSIYFYKYDDDIIYEVSFEQDDPSVDLPSLFTVSEHFQALMIQVING